jgi:hypothetical protein
MKNEASISNRSLVEKTDMNDIGQGQTCHRRCTKCGEALELDDGEHCSACRPKLSAEAKAVGDIRAQARDEVRALELMALQLETAIRRLDHKVRLHGKLNPKGHARHSPQADGDLASR